MRDARGTIIGASKIARGIGGRKCMEMAALLCAAGDTNAALTPERMRNSLAAEHRFSLFCAYPLGSFGDFPDLDMD